MPVDTKERQDVYQHGALTYDPAGATLTMRGRQMAVTEADKVLIRTATAPRWWQDLVSQADQVRSSEGVPLILWLPGGDYLMVGRHSESFIQWAESVGIQCEYHRGVGTLMRNPHFPDTLGSNMSRSGVQATTVASSYLNPVTEQSKILAASADEATSDGYEIPRQDVFPSERVLMKHQVPVVLTLAHRGRGILADDVGSGKSSMFICGFIAKAQYRHLVLGENLSHTFPLVIVTKKKLVAPTAREVNAWFSALRVAVVGDKRKDAITIDEADVIVTTPGLLANNMHEILSRRPQGAVFDESHMFKNPMTKASKSAMKLVRAVRENTDHPYVVCASATPMPNRPAELWSQLKLTGMGDDIVALAREKQTYPSRVKFSLRSSRTIPVTDQTVFELRYCKGKAGPFGWDVRGADNETELYQSLRDTGLIRRRKSEFITPLPLLHQHVINCKISEEYQREYSRAEEQFPDHLVVSLRRKAARENWTDAELRVATAEALMKAQDSEAIMQMTALRELVGIAKVDPVTEWIKRFFAADPLIVGRDTTRNKLIVFAHHRKVQKALIENPDLQRFGLRSITAETKDVNAIVDEFQRADSGVNLLICYSEAREGLTLTAAKDVLVAELPFVPSWLIQMAGRCWARISADYAPHEAHLHYAVADVGTDRYLAEMIQDKMNTSRTIIDGILATEVLNEAEGED